MHEKGEGTIDIRCNNEEYSIHIIQTKEICWVGPLAEFVDAFG